MKEYAAHEKLLFEGYCIPVTAPVTTKPLLLCSSRRNLFLRREEEQARDGILLCEQHARQRRVENIINPITMNRLSESKSNQNQKREELLRSTLESGEANARVFSVEVKERSRRFDFHVWYQKSTSRALLTWQNEPTTRSEIYTYEATQRLCMDINFAKKETSILCWTGVLLDTAIVDVESASRLLITTDHDHLNGCHDRLFLEYNYYSTHLLIQKQYFQKLNTKIINCVIFDWLLVFASEQATEIENIYAWHRNTLEIRMWRVVMNEYGDRIAIEEQEERDRHASDKDSIKEESDTTFESEIEVVTRVSTPELRIRNCYDNNMLLTRAECVAQLRLELTSLLIKSDEMNIISPHNFLQCVSPPRKRRGLELLSSCMSGALAVCCRSVDRKLISLDLVTNLSNALKQDRIVDMNLGTPPVPDMQTYQRILNNRTMNETSLVPFSVMFNLNAIITEASWNSFCIWRAKSLEATKEKLLLIKQREVATKTYISLLATECQRLEDECLTVITSAAATLRELLDSDNNFFWIRKFAANCEDQIYASKRNVALLSYEIISQASMICSHWTMDIPSIESDCLVSIQTQHSKTDLDELSSGFQSLWNEYIISCHQIGRDFELEYPDTCIDIKVMMNYSINEMNLFRHKLWWKASSFSNSLN